MSRLESTRLESTRLKSTRLESTRRGDVQCGKLPHFRSKGDKTHPKIEGYININASTAQFKTSIWRQLSPMMLSPIIIDEKMPDGSIIKRKATNLENLWQSCKVWEGEIGKDGIPTKEWWKRRGDIWNDDKAHRHIIKSKPLFSWWKFAVFTNIQKEITI